MVPPSARPGASTVSRQPGVSHKRAAAAVVTAERRAKKARSTAASSQPPQPSRTTDLIVPTASTPPDVAPRAADLNQGVPEASSGGGDGADAEVATSPHAESVIPPVHQAAADSAVINPASALVTQPDAADRLLPSVERFQVSYQSAGLSDSAPAGSPAAGRIPAATYAHLTSARNRIRELSASLLLELDATEDSFSVSFYLSCQIGGSNLRWVRASAPNGCSPRDSG